MTRSSSPRLIEWCALLLLVGAVGLPAIALAQGASAQAASDKEGTVKVFLQRATEAYQAGDYKKAAGLYHRLYMMAPDRPVSLYNAARIEEKMEEYELAARHYGEFLTAAKPDHPKYALGKARFDAVNARLEANRAKAEMARLKEQAQRREVEDRATAPLPQPVDPAAPQAQVRETAQGGSWKRPAGWAVTIVGGLALAGGGALLYVGSADKATLDDELAAADKQYGDPYHDVTVQEARTRQDDIDATNTLGVIAAVSGAVFAGAGIWMLATAPERPEVAVVPVKDGAMWTMAWRF